MADINNNNNNDGEYEVYCQMCRRSKSQVRDMFKLFDGMYICSDCMHKTMDTMGQFGFSPINPFGMGTTPGASNGSINSGTPLGSIFGDLNQNSKDELKKTSGSEDKDTDKDKDKADVTVEDVQGDDEKKEGDDAPSNDQGNPLQGFPGISFLNMADIPGLFGQKTKVKKKTKRTTPLIDLSKIPQPHKIKEMLDEYVIGQERAKKIISVAVYNHYKRVVSEEQRADKYGEQFKNVDIEKSNMLLIGPTGCGKTYLVKTLAKLLDVPLAIADATSLTEAGYIGDDIESVVSKLLAAADNDVEKAETGIIFIDEIDKIAKKKDTHTRDVSGESVQQGMLKLLEGSEIEVPVGSNSKNAMVPLTTINTKNILFICGGAFPDLDEIIKQRLKKQTSIGFNAELKDALDKKKDILKEVTVDDIKKFGMIPEFVGRLPIIATLEGLNEDMLVEVLKEPKNAIIKQYQKLLAMDEVELEFDEEALHEIAKKALLKDTGARALRSIIEELMLDIMYEIPKDDNIGRVTITKDYILGTGGPIIDLRGGDMSFSERDRLKIAAEG
ncbi:MAG: ATP-dependent Clp protease ATP-binding subunit ClpX [Lachnospiraceae bacterium]|nr:ATP-dependent Clp protease ATP-binding subunit ClpX [Lachnospiraceae bacterium]